MKEITLMERGMDSELTGSSYQILLFIKATDRIGFTQLETLCTMVSGPPIQSRLQAPFTSQQANKRVFWLVEAPN